ncbi:MAG: peptidoglycan DD-metalloendopeptidase family protein [Candidatus Hydrothermae bacterium]|nr:peptidoglycan DD-metalloendopeptidase family protein [Candidatus Hydrothermae bacterium]
MSQRKRWTILIIPHHEGGEQRTFTLRKWQVVGLSVFLGLSLIALVGGLVFWAYTGSLQLRLSLTERQNRRLQAEVARVEQLENQIRELKDIRRQLLRMLAPEEMLASGGNMDTLASLTFPSRPLNESETPLSMPSESRPFGLPTRGVLARPFSDDHPGIDISAPYGTPVVATAAGKVVVVREDPTYGNLVEIKHDNGYRTRYGHMLKAVVHVGDKVKRGQIIGFVGSTGISTGPHLHYEILEKNHQVNPLFFLGIARASRPGPTS